MGINILDVFSPATEPEWLAQLIADAQLLGFPGTTWRQGDIGRSIFVIMSYAFQRTDATVSLISQGGFLDFAATGTVTYENADGTTTTVAVSPDPSDPEANPDGKPTWLDVLCESNYNIIRFQNTSAGGALAILNTSASTYGPFDAGSYHVSDPNNQATYSNTTSLSIAPSTVLGTAITNATNDGGLIKITTSTNHGLTTGDPVFIADVTGTTEANGAWYVTVLTATTFDLQGSNFSNAYVAGGTAYAPTVTTVTADKAGTAFNSVDANGDLAVNVVTTTVTALVGVSVSNLAIFEGSDIESNVELRDRAKLKLQSITTNGAAGAYEFYALSSITYAPLLPTPLTVSTRITRVYTTEDKATGTAYVFLANAAGPPSTDDLTATDAVLQVYARPLGVTLVTAKATTVNAAVVLHVYLRAAYNTAANKALLVTAIQDYFKTLPIGGLTDPGGAYTNVLPLADLLGVVYETAATNKWIVDDVTLTINGSGTVNLSLPVSTSVASVAVLSPAIPTITFHPT
jgi:hypothetical protein